MRATSRPAITVPLRASRLPSPASLWHDRRRGDVAASHVFRQEAFDDGACGEEHALKSNTVQSSRRVVRKSDGQARTDPASD